LTCENLKTFNLKYIEKLKQTANTTTTSMALIQHTAKRMLPAAAVRLAELGGREGGRGEEGRDIPRVHTTSQSESSVVDFTYGFY
jgi:hypothetical protein